MVPAAFTSDVTVEQLQWADGGHGVFTRPEGDGPHPAFIVVLGAEPADPDDPRVQRLTGGLARIGFATLLARSEPLIDGRVTPDEIPLLVGAFQAAESHPAVRADRVGFVGLSVGGSLLLVASADPAIADRVAFVLAMGAHYDGGRLAAEVLSSAYETPSGRVAWEPNETSVRVVRNTLLAALARDEAAAIESGGAAATEDGRVVAALLQRPSLDRALELLRELSVAAQGRLTAISPSAHMDGVRAPVYLLHDVSDPFIPWTHSEAIAASYAEEAYHRLEIFEHVEPRRDSIGVLLRDGWKLLGVFAEIIGNGLEREPVAISP
jgi:dienelactone hydrolase